MSVVVVAGYVMEEFSGCLFGDDRQGNVSYSYSFIFNRQPVLGYSEESQRFVPCTYCIKGMYLVADAACDVLNANQDAANRVKQEERRCKDQVKTFWDKTVERRVKPSVEVFSPVKVHAESLPVLLCHVSGFYPSDINVAWYRNNKLIRNYRQAVRVGDWTYQIVAALDLRDSHREDNFTCLVDHPSLELPITIDWSK
ncbi:HLA class II histocompatibility antigen, DM beta chain-like [Gastrophryne carolinensis]